MIQVQNLSVLYGGLPALRAVTLDVKAGQWVLVTGPSGCGKSTLARAVCGIIPHALPAEMQGSIRVDSLDTREHPLPALAQHVGMVFQNPAAQLFHLHVADEIAFGPRNLGLPEAEVQARVDWALETTGLAELRQRRPSELSGGQKQSIAIAAVLAMRPQVLVLDEPTASLDLPNTFKVMETLAYLRDHYGITILMIEHRLAAAIQRVDRVLLMDQGEVVFDGSPEDAFADQDRRDVLGLRRPMEQPMTPWRQLIQPNGQREGARKPLISLENVTAGYNGHDVIHDIDLEIFPGDFLAVVGSNGAGKSTLALVIAGLLKPRKGRLANSAGKYRPKPGLEITLLFQNAADQLFTDSVDEEVAFGPRNYDCFQDATHLRTLSEADLLSLRERRPTALSIGQQQRTALAACLSLRPQLVILDEPTLGQDWRHLQQLMDFLRQLNQAGTAVLLISHDYKLVHHYAHRIILMENGRIKMSGKTSKGEKNEIQHA
jgi:energy-coupling factor transporter ATP-binding protein EcfA2